MVGWHLGFNWGASMKHRGLLVCWSQSGLRQDGHQLMWGMWCDGQDGHEDLSVARHSRYPPVWLPMVIMGTPCSLNLHQLNHHVLSRHKTGGCSRRCAGTVHIIAQFAT
jgi:hypothetical protein